MQNYSHNFSVFSSEICIFSAILLISGYHQLPQERMKQKAILINLMLKLPPLVDILNKKIFHTYLSRDEAMVKYYSTKQIIRGTHVPFGYKK